MATTTIIDKYQDVLDSRDILDRIEDLETWAKDSPEDVSDGEREELAILKALAEEASASPDWPYGETLIRDSYFREYAEQLADDIGAVPDDAKWPLTHIDWEAAARELQYDYFPVDFDGVMYWIRN
jgi:antirestriction protein